jgi:hypothetical protein
MKNNANAQARVPDDIVMAGGKYVTVSFIGKPTEAEEKVLVKLVPTRLGPDLFVKMDKEPEFLATVTGKDQAWLDSISPNSWDELFRTGVDVNRPTLEAMAQRKLDSLDTAKGGAIEAYNAKLVELKLSSAGAQLQAAGSA